MSHHIALLTALVVCLAGCGGIPTVRVNDPPPDGPFTLQQTTLEIPIAEFAPAIYRDSIGYPRVDFERFDQNNQGRVMKRYDAVILENKYIRLTLLPALGKPYSFVYKVTGHEEFFLPEVAHIHASPNRLGWWFMLGGVEYTLPDMEHGDTWAAEWTWEIVEDSETRKTVRMAVRELRYGLTETIDISIVPDKAWYEAAITIENPTAEPVDFQHWINPMWAPGGRGEITPRTEFVIPTDEVIATERKINDWMLDYHPERARRQSWADSPMRFLSGWKSTGDLLAGELKHGFFAAFAHEEDEGIVRIFPEESNPGCNIWAWGIDPPARLRKLFSGDESNLGYTEMWGGITHGFDKYHRLGAGESMEWVEWMYPFHGTQGLHFASEEFAVTFTRESDQEYAVRLCPSGDLRDVRGRVVSRESGDLVAQILCESASPRGELPELRFESAAEGLELLISQAGDEIVRLEPR